MSVDNVVFEFAKDEANGDSTDMTVDGSATEVHFDLWNRSRKILSLERMNIVVRDGSIDMPLFGGITALTNGVQACVVDTQDRVRLDFLEGDAIKSNGDWVFLAGSDSVIITQPGAGDDQLSVRWSLFKAIGGIGLQIEPGWRMRFVVRDNLTALSRFQIMGQGYLFNNGQAPE